MTRPQNANRRTPWRSELGARLRDLRAALCGHDPAGRVRTEPLLSHLGHVPRHTWYNWERGHDVPVEAILNLIVCLRVSPAWLRDGDWPMFTGDEPPWDTRG